jgi:hypothetical protein
VLSILISLGSPAWICSSLALAVQFQRVVRQRIKRIRKELTTGPTAAYFKWIDSRCQAADTILQSSLQAPVRLSSREGRLSNLIASPENHEWWTVAAANITALQRKIDMVFVAQSAAAALAWVLAIVGDFSSLPGEVASANSSEWQICMGSLWLWLVSNFCGCMTPSC